MKLFERHQDYVMSLGTLDPGQLLQGFTLSLDPDAPFILRSIAIRCQYNQARQQAGLQSVALRYTGTGNDYKQQALIPVGLNMAYFGQQGNPKPLSVPITYPQNGTITVDMQNQGTATLTNVQLFFRGVKLFQPGAVRMATYPPKMRTQNWIYSDSPLSVAPNGTIATNLPANTVTQGQQYIFRPDPDSDFVLRSIGWGPVNAALQPYEIFMLLQDVDNKPFANAPVHLDVLCSNPFGGAPYPCGDEFIEPIGTGFVAPGLFFSEIYVPRNSLLYYNIVRDDAQFTGQGEVSVPLIFSGSKVYAQ